MEKDKIQTTIAVPWDTRDALEKLANQDRRSMAQEVAFLIEQEVKKRSENG